MVPYGKVKAGLEMVRPGRWTSQPGETWIVKIVQMPSTAWSSLSALAAGEVANQIIRSMIVQSFGIFSMTVTKFHAASDKVSAGHAMRSWLAQQTKTLVGLPDGSPQHAERSARG